jgi:small-conductance mechanosensitive channel
MMRWVFLLFGVLFSRLLRATTASDISQTVTKGGDELIGRATDVYNFIVEHPLFHINGSDVTALALIWVVLVIISALVFSALLRRTLTRVAARSSSISASALYTLGRLLHYISIAVAIFISLAILGVDFTELAIVAGALSVGIGFGLQSIFNNFISGLILLFERPMKVGDLILLDSGVRGRVKAINVRSTRITTWDNVDVLVPNSEFISGKVTNYTLSDDVRRLHIPFGVAYGSDKDLVKKAGLEAALELPSTLNRGEFKPDVWLVNYGDSSLDFELIVWVNGNTLPKDKHPIGMYLWELETKLSEYGLEIPFPQRDLHLRSADKMAAQALGQASKA